ncbi:MAG: CHAT domain-containing protein, partial [Byssovorax sp.]
MRSYVVRVIHRTEGAALSFADLDANPASVLERKLGEDEVEDLIRRVKTGDSWDSSRIEAIGDALYRWLDGPEHWLEPILADRSDVALLLDTDGAFRGLPWELLHAKTFLCAHPHRLVTPVRRLSGAGKQPPPDACNRPLRVLFMASSPEAVQPVLDFEQEEARILEATKAQPIELIVEESGTLRGLEERLRDFGAGHFDVVHLSGHAGRVNGRACFFFEDDRGGADPIFADKLARAFEAAWPRLLFLSGCSTGQAFEQGDLPSLCEALVAAGAPAVLGWALPVGDDAASLAAEALYDRLGSGGRIDEAVAIARRKLFEERSTHWPLLRLYADATPLDGLVTPKKTPGRAKRHIREARSELIQAGSLMEVCHRSAFIGRRRSIQRCLRVLLGREGDEGHAEGVLLHGLGGLGKSSLAARLCDRMPEHRRVVCVGRLDEIQLLGALSKHYPAAIKLL